MDNCCFQKKLGSSYMIILLYVDDMLIARSDMHEIKKIEDIVVNRVRDEGLSGC